MNPKNTKQLTNFLRSNCSTFTDEWEVVQHKDYVYFWGPGAARWYTTNTNVAKIEHLSFDDWKQVWNEMSVKNIP